MEQPPRPSWWSRNWKWALPVGCVTPVVLCGGLVGGILLIVFGAIRSSDVFTESLSYAKASPNVRAALGEPIEAAYFVSGSISVHGESGNAELEIPISGPKGSATIHVVAKKVDGKWVYSKLEVEPKMGGRINLLTERRRAAKQGRRP
jgi:Cytochrome oxidase complex assembly protein 1